MAVSVKAINCKWSWKPSNVTFKKLFFIKETVIVHTSVGTEPKYSARIPIGLRFVVSFDAFQSLDTQNECVRIIVNPSLKQSKKIYCIYLQDLWIKWPQLISHPLSQ